MIYVSFGWRVQLVRRHSTVKTTRAVVQERLTRRGRFEELLRTAVA
jgi:hypothetical protein